MHHVITGGAGFIGSHLAEALVAGGHSVTVLDDFSTGRRANLAALDGRPGVKVIEGSVLDPATVARACKGAEVIVHLAATVGVKLVIDRPVETLVNNVRGTEVVLEAASRLGVRTLIASTSEVYGKLMSAASSQTALHEDDDILIGRTSVRRWGYACSKALDEFLALAYATEHRLPMTAIRFFNTVGPRQRGEYGMVLPRFIEAALAGTPIRVHGDGTQSRCFHHVADSVQSLLAILASPATHGQVLNLGSDLEITMLELAAMVREETHSTSVIELEPYEEAFGSGFEDMRRRVPDLGKLRALLGPQPVREVRSIVREVVAWQRAQT
ncbi:MAG: NAD-dependent epimerase/dehydratase family protein [Planctomycetes bacterium]|nr:NAD-dependent epimerase/dehydratase family protein [Planctomycetota bacterium]